MADRVVWEQVTKGQAGIRWDSVVENVWNDMGGNQEELLPLEKFAGYKTEVKERPEIGEMLALRNKVKEEERLEIYGGLRRRNGNENVSARPNGLRENAETATSCGGPGPARKKRYASSRQEEDEDAQMCPCANAVE